MSPPLSSFIVMLRFLSSFLQISSSAVKVCLCVCVCLVFVRCASDDIHKDFRKAIGANCIFYSAQTHDLIVLVRKFQNSFKLDNC